MENENSLLHSRAADSFANARRRAAVGQFWSRLTGRQSELLPFNEIRALLKQKNPAYRGVQLIQLDQIAGSVGRFTDFNRQFLPLNDALLNRWQRVESLAVGGEGWPPIETYLVGKAYFIKDGNHRVAVARQMGVDDIEAHVWEFPEQIELLAEDSLDDVLIRFGERRFMALTRLDELRPEHGLRFTTPGRYTELLAQIEQLKETLKEIDGDYPTAEEATVAWYDLLYLPVVQIIRESTLLRSFPGRTEADLFAWLSTHREQLERHYRGYGSLAELAQSLADHYGERVPNWAWRHVRRLLGADVLPALPFGDL